MIPAAISDYLEREHARYAVLPHATAYTAQQEAAAAHVPGMEWAKTVVCFADDRPILAVVPAPFTVDLNRLKRTAHAQSLRLANEREFAHLYQDCEPGAMPPFGPLFGQPVFVDEQLTRDVEVSFSAGSHHEAIRMPYREFERLAQPVVGDFASARAPASTPRATTLTDPVCGAVFSKDDAAAWSEHSGQRYYFCSRGCKMEFDDNPAGYARM